MLKILLCDDNMTAMNDISQHIRSFFSDLSIDISLTQCLSTTELEKTLSIEEDFDLFVFDIELGGKHNGLYYAKRVCIRNPDATIIFISLHADYARFGYLYHAIRYVYKPQINLELPEALSAAYLQIKQKQSERVLIQHQNDYWYIELNDIVYIERYDRMLLIYTHSNSIYNTSLSLRDFYSRLNHSDFIYINKSMIVNIRYIACITGSQIHLTDRKKILELSRRCSTNLRRKISLSESHL